MNLELDFLIKEIEKRREKGVKRRYIEPKEDDFGSLR